MYIIYVTYNVYIYIFIYLCIVYISSHSKGPEQDQLRSPFVPYARNTAERSIHNFFFWLGTIYIYIITYNNTNLLDEILQRYPEMFASWASGERGTIALVERMAATKLLMDPNPQNLVSGSWEFLILAGWWFLQWFWGYTKQDLLGIMKHSIRGNPINWWCQGI